MKRLYTMTIVSLLAAAATIQASAASVTLKVADPAAISVAKGGAPVAITAGDNVVEYEPTEYNSLYITAASGYKLESVKCENAQYGDLYVSSGYSASLYLSEYVDGNIYTVNTVNLDAMRTATATIKVLDDYTMVRASRAGGSTIDIAGAETQVKFIPGDESPFQFNTTSYGQLYQVKLNDQKVQPANGYHSVPVADGDVIEIQAKYPDIDVPVYVTIPDDARGAIQEFSVDYSPVTNYFDDEFTVKAGSTITINFDTQNYKVEAITINDQPQYSTYVSYKVEGDPVYIDIDAHPYGNLDFTLNIDNPSHVNVYPGQSSYATPFALSAGSNSLSVNENIGCIYIKAAAGYVIKSITDAQGADLTLQYNVLYVQNGMQVNITTEEINYDGKFAVYVDSTEGLYTAYWSDEETRENTNLEAGYNVVKFATSAQVMYMVCVSGQIPYIAYKNGVLIANNYESTYFSQQSYPENGDVYKVYTQGNAPELHNITFDLQGEGTDGVAVTTDVITPCPDFVGGVSVLTGTQIAVTVPVDGEFSVLLDDEPLEAAEGGAYVFAATADHKVTVAGTTGISNVAADRVADGPVYNLQGIRVLDSASDAAAVRTLPAGVYIANGKKFVVR